MSEKSNKIKDNIVELFELELAMAQVKVAKEEKIKWNQSIWKIGNSIRLYLHVSAEGRRLSEYTEYFFGFQDSLRDHFQEKYEERMLFACGYTNGMPEKLYLIHATDILHDETIVQQQKDSYKLHIELYHNGRQRIRENQRDIKGDLISVYELPKLLLYLAIQEDMNLGPAKYIYEYEGGDVDRVHEITRMLMDAAEVIELKQSYQWRCQICSHRISIGSDLYYAEAYHIWPLRCGGTAERSNILVVCPNHHREFEYGCLRIVPDDTNFAICHMDPKNEFNKVKLCLKSGHEIDPKNLKYHEKNIWRGDSGD